MTKPTFRVQSEVMERPPIEIPEPNISKRFCSVSQSPRSILFQHGYPLSPTLSTDSSQQSIPMSPRCLSSPPVSPIKSQLNQALSGSPSNLRRCSSLQALESHLLDSLHDGSQMASTTVGHPPSRSSGVCLQRPCIISPTKAGSTATPHPSHDHQGCVVPETCGLRSDVACWQHLPSRQVKFARGVNDTLRRVSPIPRDCCSAPTTPRSGALETFTTDRDLSSQMNFRLGEDVLVRCNDSKWLVGQVRRLSNNGLKVWIRSARTLVNIPPQLLASHAAKVDGSLGHQQASNYTTTSGQASFTTTVDELRALVHCVRPAHLAHRHLYQLQSMGGGQEELPKPAFAARDRPVDSRLFHNPAAPGSSRTYDPSICRSMESVMGSTIQGSPHLRLISTSSLQNFAFYRTDSNFGEDKYLSYLRSKESHVDRPMQKLKPGLPGTNMLISWAENPCLNEFMTKADSETQDFQTHDTSANRSIPQPHLLLQRSQPKKHVFPNNEFNNSPACGQAVLPRPLNYARMRSKDTEEVLYINVDDMEPALRGQAKVVKFSREYLSQHSVRHRHGHVLTAFAPGSNKVVRT